MGIKNYFFILIFCIPIFSYADQREQVNFISGTLLNINNWFNVKKKCNEELSNENNCSAIFNVFERDQSTGLFFGMLSESPWAKCKKQLTPNGFTVLDLEKKYSSSKEVSLGLPSNYFSQQIVKCLKENKSENVNEAEDKKKMLVSLSYAYLNRTSENTSQLLRELKNIDFILEENVNDESLCNQFVISKDKDFCKKINALKCDGRGEFDSYANKTANDLILPVITLKQRLYTLRSQSYSRGSIPSYVKEEIKKLEKTIEFYEDQNPILKGKVLKNYFKNIKVNNGFNETEFKVALKEQLKENKKSITNRIAGNASISDCIKNADKISCEHFEENTSKLPVLKEKYFFNKKSSGLESKLNLTASEFYNSNQCLDDNRELKNEFNDFALDFTTNVGLTLMSGGVSVLTKVGSGLKYAMSANRMMMAIDAGQLASGISDALINCSNELNKLEMKPNDKELSCPIKSSSIESTVVSNYQSCVNGILLTSLNGLPFVPLAFKKVNLQKDVLLKMSDKIKSSKAFEFQFKQPQKAFDSYDIVNTGSLLKNGTVSSVDKVFQRDGVYVYIMDLEGNIVISHRTPNLNSGTKDTDQFLETHRGLFNKLRETSNSNVVAAGEIRVVGGFPTVVNPRAGSFHNNPEDILKSFKENGSKEDVALIDRLLNEYRAKPKDDPFYILDFVESNPEFKLLFDRMNKTLDELSTSRLGLVKDSLKEKGLLSEKVETKFVNSISGDAHIEGKAAAVVEINCNRNEICNDQMKKLSDTAKKFISKFNSPEQAESAVIAKIKFNQKTENFTTRDRAFEFFNLRSHLLFKEGPIEFLQNSHPERYGIKMEDALKYLKEWSDQF